MITTDSRRLRMVARICRALPPALSAKVMNRYFRAPDIPHQGISFSADSSLAPLRFDYSGHDQLAISFAIRGFHEWRNVVVANVLCRPGDTIIDIGAHLGTETIHFAAIVAGGGRLIAFEPVPGHAEHLRTTLEANRLTHAEVVQAAVSNRGGSVSFYLAPDAANQGQGSMWELHEGQTNRIEVDCLTLDDFCESRDLRPNFIATDAEGGEPEILEGAARVLREARPYLLMEHNTERFEDRGLTTDSFAKSIRDTGYDCYCIGRFGLKPADFSRFMNWVGIPNDDPAKARSDYRRLNRAILRAGLLPVWRGLNPAVIRRGATR